jgi:hypothetical protein
MIPSASCPIRNSFNWSLLNVACVASRISSQQSLRDDTATCSANLTCTTSSIGLLCTLAHVFPVVVWGTGTVSQRKWDDERDLWWRKISVLRRNLHRLGRSDTWPRTDLDEVRPQRPLQVTNAALLFPLPDATPGRDTRKSIPPPNPPRTFPDQSRLILNWMPRV